MEEILGFAATVIIISASGVMSPGPLFAANIFYGLKEGFQGGLKMAAGHTLVEFPLVIILGIGVVSMETVPQIREIIAITGAVGLFAFAGLQIKNVFLKNSEKISQPKYGPFLAGILFSALNPFFIIWWFTIGFKLISDSILLWSWAGIGIMFALHIWMDYAWLGIISIVSKKGAKILSSRNYKTLILIIAGMLIIFGINFLTTI